MSLNRKGMAATFLANTYLLSPEFMALQPSAKGWWLQLQALCSSQENAGRLVGATKWSNGAWQQAMGNGGGKSALKTLVSHGLVEVDDEDVIVKGYHHESEARYQAARLNASKGGKVTQARRANAASPNAAGSSVPESAESLDEASSVAQASLKRRSSDKGEAGEAKNGNGSDGNERQRNGSECTETGSAPPPDDAPPPDGDPVVLRGQQAARDDVRPLVTAHKLELATAPRSPTTTIRQPLPPDGPGERWSYDWRGRAVNLDKEQPAPVAPTGATPALPTASPILEELDAGLRFRTGTTATEQDRKALVAYYEAQPAQNKEPVLGRFKAYWKNIGRPSVTGFLAQERGAG